MFYASFFQATQYNCDFQNLAPQGCVQYFFGSNLGDVRSYNYQNRAGVHLANQDQMICVRYSEETVTLMKW